MDDHQAMLAIQEQMDGVEWDSDTLSAIGDIMVRAVGEASPARWQITKD
ncbi:hypothetical protein [Bradyrhizobium elkanii]|nr:hypothetical protein [Bradyrhizobium elkanii]WLB77007.1 hypothetical protein QIH83_21565 [Bradyrhizobium elkanii]